MSPTRRARLDVLVAALLFSTGGVAIKSCTADAWQVACFRSAIAAVAMFVAVPSARRHLRLGTWAAGLAFGATMVLFVLANRSTTAANAIFLQNTSPLYVLVLAPWLLGERVRSRDLVAMAAMAGGLALILLGDETASVTAPAPARGNLFAASAGLTWALTVIGLRWTQRAGSAGGRSAAAAVVVSGNVLAAGVSLPGALRAPLTLGPTDWGIIVFLGVVQIVLAYLFLNRGVGGLRAFEVALLLLVEPVFSTVWALAIHGETPSVLAGMGAVVIVAATIVNAGFHGKAVSSA